ncbi:efflux RND transporter periplasmic adaptor subunit [Novosphingobium resinovorum]|uniref:efflux RND transporter periplasmic adaptor subunit n=1 Tax=Novosphingobium resinovorum TaxID=158500 RepID=UPI002ED55F02|nr:efflux RND transporter periplasmic adaptor subunit [Novosphingobium resinovorum]
MNDKTPLYAGAALALVIAAGVGFGAARLTQPAGSADNDAAETVPAATPDHVEISNAGIKLSQIAIAPAASGELDAAIPASASVEAAPDAEAVLTARAPGTVTRIFKRIGDPVRAGETLALVESRDASSIAADQSAAAARVTLASRQLDRERKLLDQGVSPRADFETAQANLAVAHADAMRASAAAGAARIARDGRSVMVTSPVSGRLTMASANLGQFVAAETELFRVADPRSLQITASVPAAEAARVRTGDRVELLVGEGRTIEGRVRSSTGVVDPQSRGATVILEATGASGLAPGQMLQARIFASGGAVRGGVMVPQDAVQTTGARTVVFIRTPRGFRAQAVQVGSRSGGLVSIVSGLMAGTRIATSNAFLLKAELEKETAE